SQRHLFDIPDEIAFFNIAYYSPQLNESTNRLLSGARAKSHPWERTTAQFFDDAETIRTLASSIFGGEADGYAVVPAVSYGVSTAARIVEPHLKPGDRILVIAEGFPSDVFPWKRTAQEVGAMMVTVPYPEDGDWTRAILGRIDKSVKVVAVPTCHWTNGAYIDLRPIGEACRDAGSVLVVDATQSLGAMPFPMAEVKPDFLVAAGYKWLLSPYGFSLLYVAERWRSARPLEEAWQARSNARDFTALVNYSDTYMPGARKFDVGEKCSPTILPGAIAALEQLGAWGVDNIAETLSAINARIATHLEHLGFQLPVEAQRCPHLLGALLPGGQTGDLVSALRERNIYISQRGNALRFAPHLHINGHDEHRLMEALDQLVG
ncbi:MAG: aminotransferase class V-fold PLP-dependent enzyme, partial [Dehalococcoidia bacterium]|nr:aminotransferase class V-fold PLP-dependent enzyme [Dehalococcoidia bacterium]